MMLKAVSYTHLDVYKRQIVLYDKLFVIVMTKKHYKVIIILLIPVLIIIIFGVNYCNARIISLIYFIKVSNTCIL